MYVWQVKRSFETTLGTQEEFSDVFIFKMKDFSQESSQTYYSSSFSPDNLDNIKTAIRLDFKTIHLVDPYQIKNEIYKFLN